MVKPRLGNRLAQTLPQRVRHCELLAKAAMNASKAAFKQSHAALDAIQVILNTVEQSEVGFTYTALSDPATCAFVEIVGTVLPLTRDERRWVLSDVQSKLSSERGLNG